MSFIPISNFNRVSSLHQPAKLTPRCLPSPYKQRIRYHPSNSVYVVLELDDTDLDQVKQPGCVVCVCYSYATAVQHAVQGGNRTIIGPTSIVDHPNQPLEGSSLLNFQKN